MFQKMLQLQGGGGGGNIGTTYNEIIFNTVDLSTKTKVVEESGKNNAITLDFVAPKDEIYCFYINRYGGNRSFTSITINGETYKPTCIPTTKNNVDTFILAIYLRKGDNVSAVTNADSNSSSKITAKVYI